jgi:hypothetical protein
MEPIRSYQNMSTGTVGRNYVTHFIVRQNPYCRENIVSHCALWCFECFANRAQGFTKVSTKFLVSLLDRSVVDSGGISQVGDVCAGKEMSGPKKRPLRTALFVCVMEEIQSIIDIEKDRD